MKKTLFIILATLVFTAGSFCEGYAEDFDAFSIVKGMRQSEVEQQFGARIIEKTTQMQFLVMPVKKVLIEVDAENYVAVSFFMKKVYKVAVLKDTSEKDAQYSFNYF